MKMRYYTHLNRIYFILSNKKKNALWLRNNLLRNLLVYQIDNKTLKLRTPHIITLMCTWALSIERLSC